jgi:hypothetical protein
MKRTTWLSVGVLGVVGVLNVTCSSGPDVEPIHETRKRTILDTADLIAFWDFEHTVDDVWMSRFNEQASSRSFPLYLRQIGDDTNYSIVEWPHEAPEAKILVDSSGVLGSAVRFNQGYIYGAVPRDVFDESPLDLHGTRPFTLIAWVKFVGERHMVAGIWDEGGWQKYSGRRQAALFAGLFQQKGVIAHVSVTGAASYPQSGVDGAQYARIRAIDGEAFENEQWVAMAMTYDPDKREVRAFLNGEMTPLMLADPVSADVFQFTVTPSANPLAFEGPIYSPRSFVLKYNGYSLSATGISEHRLHVDLDQQTLTYEQEGSDGPNQTYRIMFDIERAGASLLGESVVMAGVDGKVLELEFRGTISVGDEIITTLEHLQDGEWTRTGTELRSKITLGAPFTFGRALGLDSEEIEHGSQLFLDGVAVFSRVLSDEELERLSFAVEE